LLSFLQVLQFTYKKLVGGSTDHI